MFQKFVVQIGAHADSLKAGALGSGSIEAVDWAAAGTKVGAIAQAVIGIITVFKIIFPGKKKRQQQQPQASR